MVERLSALSLSFHNVNDTGTNGHNDNETGYKTGHNDNELCFSRLNRVLSGF